jgi:hypothetical protein
VKYEVAYLLNEIRLRVSIDMLFLTPSKEGGLREYVQRLVEEGTQHGQTGREGQ